MAHIPPDAISCSFDGDTPRLYKKEGITRYATVTILKIYSYHEDCAYHILEQFPCSGAK